MTQTKAVVVQTFLLGAIFSAVPVVSALAADEAGQGMRGSVGGPMIEQFRGDGERPPVPTVDNCVERTGKTEAECKTMIANFGGNRPEANRNGEGLRSEVKEKAVSRMKRSLSEVFDRIRERIEKTVNFLKEKGVATGDLESASVTLKEKMTAAETAHEAYRTAFVTWEADKSDGNKTALENARTSAKTAADAVRSYYRETVLPLVKAALESA